MRNIGKREDCLLWEDGFHSSHTHLHLLPAAEVPPGLQLRLRNAVAARALLWVDDGNLWEPAVSRFLLGITGIVDFRKGNWGNSLCFMHQALGQPLPGCLSFPCLSDPFQTRKHWGITSWTSLGWTPTEKCSWGVSGAASSTHMWASVGFWNFPCVPCSSRKIPG